MNRALRIVYERVPSFRREDGGLYGIYAGIYSRVYATRMQYLHRRGRHGGFGGGRCQWCGHSETEAMS